jgi:hypothetical protein
LRKLSSRRAVPVRRFVSRGACVMAIVAALGIDGCGDNPDANRALGNGVRSIVNQAKGNGWKALGGAGAVGASGGAACAGANACP